jgi:hypothetical protein
MSGHASILLKSFTLRAMGKATFLDSLFLTGPDGAIYEFPAALAAQHRITTQREKELGHLPIRPYPIVCGLSADTTADSDADEVSGRHKVVGPGGGAVPSNWTFHQTLEFGTYLDPKTGRYVQGIHRHPWGDERGEGASDSEFA